MSRRIPELLRRGVEILFEDRTGIPKFLGVDRTSEGFARNGYPRALGWERAYSGCHWCAIPGKEYTVNDCVKINLARVFEVALQRDDGRSVGAPSVDELWAGFEKHTPPQCRGAWPRAWTSTSITCTGSSRSSTWTFSVMVRSNEVATLRTVEWNISTSASTARA